MTEKTDATAEPSSATPEQLTDEQAETVRGGAPAPPTRNLKQTAVGLFQYQGHPPKPPE